MSDLEEKPINGPLDVLGMYALEKRPDPKKMDNNKIKLHITGNFEYINLRIYDSTTNSDTDNIVYVCISMLVVYVYTCVYIYIYIYTRDCLTSMTSGSFNVGHREKSMLSVI